MIYLKSIHLPSLDHDETCGFDFLNNTHKSAYPYHVLSYRGLFDVEFDDVTIITGGNGTGKSTLLNVIAQKLRLTRQTPFNNSEYFEKYLHLCSIEKSRVAYQMSVDMSMYGRIITSDEVFDYMIENRLENEEIDEQRRTIVEEIDRLREGKMPTHLDLENPESIKAYRRQSEARRKSKARYVKDHLGFNLTENSNGENAFKFFTDAIKPFGLYLLDEPENSLSAERQTDLSEWISSMARFERCQFIISTHSPFIMSTHGAKLYNLDVYPARVMPWTEVSSVRTYHDFFEKHAEEFKSSK